MKKQTEWLWLAKWLGVITLICAFTTKAETFVAGVDYEVIVPSEASPVANSAVPVVEFFSYGCPWCNRLEPLLEQWLQTKPANSNFARVPVVFEPGWEWYAKAYYVASAYKVADKMTPQIFKAIHDDHKDLSSAAAIREYLIQAGVPAAEADSGLQSSPSIDAQVTQGTQLMQQYGVMSVPTIVVAGRYKTDPRMSKGSLDRMLAVVDHLVKLSAQPQKKQG
jgi:thiol:disulfide interchange protein DsbA